MVDNKITIDLDQFKLFLHYSDKINLCLHFDSPSRRFYLSVIALVLNEMKRVGQVTPISLSLHYENLALLNETVGASAGSSEKEKLLRRIYKKWKSALPDIENAPLFRIPGKKKSFEESFEKIYSVSAEAKDAWANLFDYQGSDKNVRLRFSIERLNITLDNATIIYRASENLTDYKAWDKYITDLKQEYKKKKNEPVKIYTLIHKATQFIVKIPVSVRLCIATFFIIGFLIFFLNVFQTPKQNFQSSNQIDPTIKVTEKPSIVVLPFLNLSGDPGRDYLVDGITETFITGLAMLPELFVIARNSAFTYKGKAVNVQQVSNDLGVRYVVEGSVQIKGRLIRITAQLIDGVTGGHIWAEQYDRNLDDWFEIQDEITLKIINALQVKLTEGEQARVFAKETKNVKAYLKYIQGRASFVHFTKSGNMKTRELAETIIDLDPNYSGGYSLLAISHIWDARLGWSTSPKESLTKAELLAKKMLELDGSLALPHIILANIYILYRNHNKAIAEMRLAVSLESSSDSMFQLAQILHFSGEYKETIEIINNWLPYDPTPAPWVMAVLGRSYYFLGQYEDALIEYNKALARAKAGEAYPVPSLIFLVAINVKLDRMQQAQRLVSEILQLKPDFTLEKYYVRREPYANQADIVDLVETLSKAGLK